MLLIELGLIGLATWQYNRWQTKLHLTIAYTVVTGDWNQSAGVWMWQGAPVRILTQDNGTNIMVVGDKNATQLMGIQRPWLAQHGC